MASQQGPRAWGRAIKFSLNWGPRDALSCVMGVFLWTSSPLFLGRSGLVPLIPPGMCVVTWQQLTLVGVESSESVVSPLRTKRKAVLVEDFFV